MTLESQWESRCFGVLKFFSENMSMYVLLLEEVIQYCLVSIFKIPIDFRDSTVSKAK